MRQRSETQRPVYGCRHHHALAIGSDREIAIRVVDRIGEVRDSAGHTAGERQPSRIVNGTPSVLGSVDPLRYLLRKTARAS